VLKPQHLSVGFVDPIPGFGGKGCLYSTNAGATVVAGDLGKIEAWHGVQVAAWTGPMAAAPAIAASPLFYGSQQCDKLFVADFQVSNATTKVSAGGKPSSSGPFSPTLLVGDRDRKGQYADLSGITSTQLLTAADHAACKTAANPNQCENAKLADVCSRLIAVSYVAWKQGGQDTGFKLIASQINGFFFDGNILCTPAPAQNGMFNFSIVNPDPVDPSIKLDTLPLSTSRTDTYRLVVGLALAKKTMTQYKGSTNDMGKMSGDAMWLFNPNQYPPSDNPIVEQLPVEAALRPF